MDYSSLAQLILRIGFAGAIAFNHGLPKLLAFTNMMKAFPDPLGIGSVASLILVVSAEFFCAILVVVGIFTRFAVIPLILSMAVAFFIVHGSDPFAKKEMAFLFLTGFLAILASGPGRFSADSIFRRVR